MPFYSGVVEEGPIRRPCDHLHGSMTEALQCAAERVMQPITKRL
jgi:hypothetical protein